ncbi:MAG: trypsin-like peptidase domain-containing protein [Planctomycetes bacterium]|nr:trypsin-like peptidase domain-containing protein [Planctomycetota bacterium]
MAFRELVLALSLASSLGIGAGSRLAAQGTPAAEDSLAAAPVGDVLGEAQRLHAREQSARIADLEPLSSASPRPYAPRPDPERPAWTHSIHRARASYLRVYLRLDLGPGDELRVRDGARALRWTYGEKGPVSAQLLGSGASAIPGFGHVFATDTVFSDRLHLELIARSGGGGVELLQLEVGYPWARLQLGAPPENPCSSPPPFPDTSCEPSATRRARARAVCGIANAGVFCTGFLASNRSHVLTANHCVPSAALAATANLWFGYETDCNGSALRGTTVIPAPQTFLGGEAARDWSLLRASSNPAAQFGWLSLEPADPNANETLYLPSHAGGRPQELSSGPARGVIGFPGNTHFQHRCDAEPGSSGAPVIRESSQCVVGLHTHGACLIQDPNSANWATRMSVLAPILLRLEPTLAICGASGNSAPPCEPAEILPATASGEGGTAIDFPFARSGAQRVQLAYGASTLDHAHPVRIRGLRWRLDGGGLASYGPASWDFALELSTSRNPPSALDRSFDANHGADRTSVFDGVLGASAIPGSGSPNAFELSLELDRAFEWDPRSGALLLDFRVRGGTAIGRALDAEASAIGAHSCLAASGSASAATATYPAAGSRAPAPIVELCVEALHAPREHARTDAPLASALPWSSLPPNGARVLTVYEATNFGAIGERRLARLAWRPDAGAAFPGGSIDVRVSLSTAPAGRASALVPSFASNHGPDRRVVFDGTATAPARAARAGAAATAALQIELPTAYVYDPARGALVVDLEIRSASAGLQGLLWDCAAGANGAIGRVAHGSDWRATIAQFSESFGAQLALGAEPVIDLPLALDGSEGAGVSFDGLAHSGPSRELTVYDGNALASLEPIFIQGLAWRPDGATNGDFGPTAWDLAIELSTCPHTAPNMPLLFDAVHGADRRVVFDGIASIPLLDPSTASPAANEVAIQLATPFRWDPAAGGLAVDLRLRSKSGASARGLDATGASASGVVRLWHPSDSRATAAQVGPEARGPALRLWAEPARGRAVPYGAACGFPAVATTRRNPQLPAPEFAFRLVRSAPTRPALLLLGLQALQLRLDFLGATGCTWLHSSDLATIGTSTDAAGEARIPAPLPPDPSLHGARFFAQWATIDPGVNAAGFALSAGLELVLER